MARLRWVLWVSVAVGLGGCAAMSEDECLVADWNTVGYEDGTRGVERISDYRKACAKAEVVPDLNAYRRGRGEGLKVYCQPASGYRVGRGGRAYAGVCPAATEPAFLDAYRVGRIVHEAEQEAERHRRTVRDLDRRIASTEGEIEELLLQLDVDEDLSPEQRKDKRAEIRVLLTERIPRLKAERATARLLVRDATAEFEALLDNPYQG